MRIMIDTNVLISAVLFPAQNMKILLHNVSSKHTLVLCSHIIEELHKITELKFPTKKPFLEKFLSKFSYDFIYTPIDLNPDEFPGIRDKDDMPILASAVLGDVDVLITGDKDFFNLDVSNNSMELPLIVTPREFMEKLI